MTDFSRLWKKWRDRGRVTTIEKAASVIPFQSVLQAMDMKKFVGKVPCEEGKIFYEEKTLEKFRKVLDKGFLGYLAYTNGFSVAGIDKLFTETYPQPPICQRCRPGFSNTWWQNPQENTWVRKTYHGGYSLILPDLHCHDTDHEDQLDRIAVLSRKLKLPLAKMPDGMGLELAFTLSSSPDFRKVRILENQLCRGVSVTKDGNLVHYGYHDDTGISILAMTTLRQSCGVLLYVPRTFERKE
jgi:hypothetical protein